MSARAGEPIDSKFEIGHVLFIDIVGYSKLLIEEQKERLELLLGFVRSSRAGPSRVGSNGQELAACSSRTFGILFPTRSASSNIP